MKSIFKEAYLAVSMDQRVDLQTERLVLRRRHSPQCRQRQIDQGQPGSVAQLVDLCTEAPGQLEYAGVSLRLQAGELVLPHLRLRIKQQTVDQSPSAERTLGG